MIEIVSEPPQRDLHMTFLGSEPGQKKEFSEIRKEMDSTKMTKPS
jgi:hypothetical protein